MRIPDLIHRVLHEAYRFDAVKNLKDRLLPVRHALFGPKGFYAALEIVRDLAEKKGRNIETVFDVGANVGDKASVLLRTFPRASVHCFEPFPESYERLKKRVAPFGSRAKLHNFGLFSEAGTRKFYVERDRGGNSLLPFDSQVRPGGIDRDGVTEIGVRRLDDFFRESGLSRIDFMKVDVEGVEKEVFQGGKEALLHTDSVFVEISPYRRGLRSRDYIEVFELLHEAGFTFVGVYEDFLFTKLLA